MALGIYVSVPFCRTKCSYCNFASDVFAAAVFERYVDHVVADMESAEVTAESTGGQFERAIDSIYLGGGTPSILDSHQLERIFVTIRQNFCLRQDTEITVECAPGTLSPPVLDMLLHCGVNRVSLGVQSFIDQESAAVGRLHKRTTILDDMARLRAAGINNINIDLIAGLPHQTAKSWELSLQEAIDSGAPHLSVYMLEIDDESRLGRELIAGGTRYHAHFVPDEELTADLYLVACEGLESAGVTQYEISNFARAGFESRHNLKYWTRQPYVGFGVDAHSMLRAAGDTDAVRYATPDSLEQYLAGAPLIRTGISRRAALEECFFLGLRLSSGVDLGGLAAQYGDTVATLTCEIDELVEGGLMLRDGNIIRLTARGRLLSNEVFGRFLSLPEQA
jgi:putative oxygen-independent coproporphyrinogen III oxidase